MRSFWLAIFLFLGGAVCAQDTIPFLNGSFEEGITGQAGTFPQAWTSCKKGTTPDIMPGVWGVQNLPSHGAAYLGLITRDDGTFEAIGQRLIRPMKAETCYRFNIDLAHSDTYSGYNLPIRLRIWAGSRLCDRGQLLWDSPLIYSTEWQTFEVRFQTRAAYRYLIIEAYYAPGVFVQYRGNILIDRLTALIECPRA